MEKREKITTCRLKKPITALALPAQENRATALYVYCIDDLGDGVKGNRLGFAASIKIELPF